VREASSALDPLSTESPEAVVERALAVAWPGNARDSGRQPDHLPAVAVGGGERPQRDRGGPEYSDMTSLGNKWYLRQAAYMSMRRLGLDHINLYYLHQSTFTDVPFEQAIGTLAGMKADGLIRHIGLSNLSAEQLRTAMSISDIAAVTAHYNVAVRLGAAVRTVAEETGIVFSPWHPGAVPSGPEGEPFHAVIDPIAARLDVTPQQIALAWQLHHTATSLPVPGTTSVAHLHENLDAAGISLTQDEVDAITALAPEDD